MEYSVIYSKRKTVALKVTPELKIEVRAPRGMSREMIEEIVSKHRRWIEKRIDTIKRQPIKTPPTQDEIRELKKRTEEIVTPLVARYAQIMGVSYTKITVTSAKKVFGSCTSKKHLNFSFRLSLYPYETIEYVVVHELCHLKEMNHSARFWALVERILPDYQKRRDLLK